MYTSKFLQDDRDLQSFKTRYRPSSPEPFVGESFPKTGLDIKPLSSTVANDKPYFEVSDSTTDLLNSIGSKRTFAYPRSDTKEISRSIPIAFKQPLGPTLSIYDKPYSSNPKIHDKSFSIISKNFDFDSIDRPLEFGNAWSNVKSNIDHKSVYLSPMKVNYDHALLNQVNEGVLFDGLQSDVAPKDMIEAFIGQRCHDKKNNNHCESPYEEPLPIAKHIFESGIRRQDGGSNVEFSTDINSGNNNDHQHVGELRPSEKQPLQHQARYANDGVKASVNPLSEDYLDQLDAHLTDTIITTARARTGTILKMDIDTDDRGTQTDIQAGAKIKANPRDGKVRGRSRRSLSLDAVEKSRAKGVGVTQKTRSRSVSRGNNVRKKAPNRIIGERTLCRSSRYEHGKKGGQSQRVEICHGDGTIGNIQNKQRSLMNNDSEDYTKPQTLKGSGLNFFTDMESPLDPTEHKVLMEFLEAMTKGEGRILMKTVARILKDRQTKKNVDPKKTTEVIYDKPPGKNNIKSTKGHSTFDDDHLCMNFIKTYCSKNGLNPIPKSQSSFSSGTGSTNLTSPTLSASPSPPMKKTNTCDRHCAVCRFIEGGDDLVKNKGSSTHRARLHKGAGAYLKDVRAGTHTVCSKSKQLRQQSEKMASRVNKALCPSENNIKHPKTNSYFRDGDKSTTNTCRISDKSRVLLNRNQGKDQTYAKCRPRDTKGGVRNLGELKYKQDQKCLQNKSNKNDDFKQETHSVNETVDEKNDRNSKDASQQICRVTRHDARHATVVKTPTPSPTKVSLCRHTSSNIQSTQQQIPSLDLNALFSTVTNSCDSNSQNTAIRAKYEKAHCSTLTSSCDLKSKEIKSTNKGTRTMHPALTSLPKLKSQEIENQRKRNGVPYSIATSSCESLGFESQITKLDMTCSVFTAVDDLKSQEPLSPTYLNMPSSQHSKSLDKNMNIPCSNVTDLRESKSQTSESQQSSLNASCSITEASSDLKGREAQNESIIDLHALTFDTTLCLSETSISQKIADLNLSAERHSKSQTSIEQDIVLELRPPFEANEGPVNDNTESGDAEDQENQDYARAGTLETNSPSFLSISSTRNTSVKRMKQEMMLHINRHTQDLLQKADEKMKNVERILDSVCTDLSEKHKDTNQNLNTLQYNDLITLSNTQTHVPQSDDCKNETSQNQMSVVGLKTKLQNIRTRVNLYGISSPVCLHDPTVSGTDTQENKNQSCVTFGTHPANHRGKTVAINGSPVSICCAVNPTCDAKDNHLTHSTGCSLACDCEFVQNSFASTSSHQHSIASSNLQQLKTSSSLLTSCWDSSISCLEVTNLDQTFTNNGNVLKKCKGNRCCSDHSQTERCITAKAKSNLFTGNIQPPTDTNSLGTPTNGKTQDDVTSTTIPQVFVHNAYDVKSAVPVQTKVCVHQGPPPLPTPRAASSQIIPDVGNDHLYHCCDCTCTATAKAYSEARPATSDPESRIINSDNTTTNGTIMNALVSDDDNIKAKVISGSHHPRTYSISRNSPPRPKYMQHSKAMTQHRTSEVNHQRRAICRRKSLTFKDGTKTHLVQGNCGKSQPPKSTYNAFRVQNLTYLKVPTRDRMKPLTDINILTWPTTLRRTIVKTKTKTKSALPPFRV